MKLRIFLSIYIFTVSLFLFTGCGTKISPPPKEISGVGNEALGRPVPPKPDEALGRPVPPEPQAFVFAGMKTITQAWDSYKADRIKEGYTLLDSPAKEVIV